MIHCKPKILSFAIRASLGIYTPAIAAQRQTSGKYRVTFI